MKKPVLLVVLVLAVALVFFVLINKSKTNNIMQTLKITSSAFKEGGSIPAKHTCDGEDVNPQILIEDIPTNAKTLALIMDDPDAPMGVWDHWVKFDIPVSGVVFEIDEEVEPAGVSGKSSSGSLSYHGPCPPDKEHRYFFKIYALDSRFDLPEGSSKSEVLNAMEGHILAQGELMGKYDRIR